MLLKGRKKCFGGHFIVTNPYCKWQFFVTNPYHDAGSKRLTLHALSGTPPPLFLPILFPSLRCFTSHLLFPSPPLLLFPFRSNSFPSPSSGLSFLLSVFFLPFNSQNRCAPHRFIGVPHNDAAVCPTPIFIFIRRFFCRTLGICHAFVFMLGNCHTLVGFLSQADWEFVTPAVLAWDFVTFRLLPTGKLSRTHWGFVTLLLGVCHEFNTLTVVFQSVSHLYILLFLY